MPVVLTMTNTSKTDATNLVYSIPNPNTNGNTTGAIIIPNAGVGSQSGACTNIAAGASCSFTAIVYPVSHPGSFTVTATPNAKTSQIRVINSKNLNASSISVTTNLGLVDVPNTSNQYYILPNSQTIASINGQSIVVSISVWVKNASAGLNNLKLVDDRGVELTSYKLTNKTPVSYGNNSVLTYQITLPTGTTLQHVQAFGYNNSNTVCSTLNIGTNNNSACSNNAVINLTNKANGILSVQPNYFNMSTGYTNQIVTLTNIGSGAVSNIQYPDLSALASQFSISNNDCIAIGNKLAAGQSCQLTVSYAANESSSLITPVFSYDDDNNSTTPNKNTNITITYTGTNSNAFSLLTITPSSVSLTESHPRVIATLTNTKGGNTAGATITSLTWPTTSLPLPLEFESTNCTQTLNIESSCIYTFKYTPNSTAGQATLPFTYNNGIQSNQTANIAADWTAAVTPTPTPAPFHWSQNSSSYTVLGESSVSLIYSGSGNPPVVTLSESSGLITFTTLVNNTPSDKCDFNLGNICIVKIVGGNAGEHTIIATANSSESKLPVTIVPLNSYVADYGSFSGHGNIWMCQITNMNGMVDGTTCQTTNGGMNPSGFNFAPQSIVFFQTTLGQKIAFVLSTNYYGDNGVFSCAVNNVTGLLTNCQNITSSLGFTPGVIYAMNIFNNIAYITDYGTGYIYQCPINALTGQLGACVNPTNNAGIPTDDSMQLIEFYTNQSESNYVIFTNQGYNGLYTYTCQINNNNSLQGCSGSSVLYDLGIYPGGIAFGFGKAYVSDSGGANSLYICDISQDANLSNCVSSPNFTGSRTEQVTIQGNLLFVAAPRSKKVWKCEINPVDGSIVSSCTVTPDVFPTGTWLPAQVAFNPYQN